MGSGGRARQWRSKMPGGVPMGEYARFMAAAMFSMALGMQAVHLLYRPLDDYVRAREEDKEKAKQGVSKKGEASVVEKKREASAVGRLLQGAWKQESGHRD